MKQISRSLRIAFYAPLKSPDHPVPSGDRQMARMLIACLERAGHEVEVMSRLRAYLPSAEDARGWQRLQAEAEAERQRIAALWQAAPPELIFCYHPYYKSPDLIGLPLSRAFALPYVTCEASYSARRNRGVWTGMQSVARDAVRHAALNLCFTGRDEEGLRAAEPEARLARLPAFIDVARFSAPARPEPGRIVTVAMMRPGDKLESYRQIAAALARLPGRGNWRLSVAGDGPARAEVMALFAALPSGRVDWLGALGATEVAALLSRGTIFLWPGMGEAYGIAYLEAQAAGLPVVACRTAGVPDVVSDEAGGTLVEPGNAMALADAVAHLLAQPDEAARLGAAARAAIEARHSFVAASDRIAGLIGAVVEAGKRA